ncbi:pleckstrin homology domain-containing family G member 4B [Amia ocellicauda]|uniref:pleckstrin homology domain-containing family G member 4B n=1 Tax=Amia ocellicauda TaxID=2972642 RepID=UPI003463A497
MSLFNMNHRSGSRTCDSYLSIKDSESLDTCIQGTLSALYPPFSATAATVLWQLFSVVERLYRGDGLRCLIDFLVPAKRILQSIQQEACVKFKGLIYHEGWPLCIHEKVVVQLAPLHKVRLKQGDFYLQIVPLGRQSAKLVIKCLSSSGQAIVEIAIQEIMYGSIFTNEFLQNVTCEKNICPLQNCLLTTGPAVYRTPWKNIVNPLFITTPETIMQDCTGSAFCDQLIRCSTQAISLTGTMERQSSLNSINSENTDSTVVNITLHDTQLNQGNTVSLAGTGIKQDSGASNKENTIDKVSHEILITDWNSPCVISSAVSTNRNSNGNAEKEVKVQKCNEKSSHQSPSFSTDLSNPGPKRRQLRDSVYFESRRLFRKSYMEALENPMNLGSSSESIIEEVTDHCTSSLNQENSLSVRQNNTSGKCSPKQEHLLRRLSVRELVAEETHKDPCQSTKPLTLQGGSFTGEPKDHQIRSKSLEGIYKVSPVKGHRARSSSGGSASGSLKKYINDALEFGRMDCEGMLPNVDKRQNITKEDSAVPNKEIKEGDLRRNTGDVCQTPKSVSKSPKIESANTTVVSADGVPHLPSQASEINQELLVSGAVILPGTRDRNGHAVIQVCTRNKIWMSEICTGEDLTCLIMYYYITLRKEKRDLGLTVVVDGRRQQPKAVLFTVLTEIQTLLPNALYSVLMLVDKDTPCKLERDATVQIEHLMSLKTLYKHIESNQLTKDFEGTFLYDHNHWIHFRQKIDSFASSCSAAISSLHNSISNLNSSNPLNTKQEVVEVINKQKRLMKCVLDDTHLIQLRLEGGTILARIKKEEYCENENYRDAIDRVTVLYNQVDEEVHKLVILSNKSLKQLESLLDIRKFEEGSNQIKLWFCVEGEKNLVPLDSITFSSSILKQMRTSLTEFLEESLRQHKKGMQLIKQSKGISNCSLPSVVHLEKKIHDFKQHLNNILCRSEIRKNELEILVNLYEFYDTANQWMEHCNEYFRQLNAENSFGKFSPRVIKILQDYHREAKKFSLENFRTLNEMVMKLNSAREVKQWNIYWQKCKQTRQHLEEILSNANADLKVCPLATKSQSDKSTEGLGKTSIRHISDGYIYTEKISLETRVRPSFEQEDANVDANSFCTSHFLLTDPFSSDVEKLGQCHSVFDDTDSDCTVDSSSASCQSEPIYSPTTRHWKQPFKKIMKKTTNYDLSARESSHSEVSHHGYTGMYIKGLEVANNVASEKTLQRSDIKSPLLGRSRSLSSPPRMHSRQPDADLNKQSRKIQHIMDEMITTEREYVRSLCYIIENYFPEMERMDLPQDLRGKRNIIFGNLEKLYDFHSQYFLKELEHCVEYPLSVSSCFLRHEEQFGMYALYSKNKPQSDTLLASHGNGFFKSKQVELGDKMDLASYLLKPIQRMSKYALLLKDMIKDCSKSQEQELTDLQAAEEMVKFQLRHGNDLLAMDAIRGCDVNLKEQGQLRCQDEFIVWCGRRKYLRHVFLFEDLILFSKTKKVDGGYDIYIYKQSYKTAEIGMTENVGDSGLRFEIWFRRRKSQDTFILQASSVEVKAVWTNIIGKILWRQALRNRELRMQEMVSMGIGNKPFMDIKPSDAAISDRAIDYIMKRTASRTRASIAVSSFDHSTPFKRPHSTISNSSTSSSSSQSSSSILGSLNLHLYPSSYAVSNCPTFNHWSFDIGTCIEEDELEEETGSQPSILTDF